MAYIGFDLDETLGRIQTAEYCMTFLYPHKALFESQWSGHHGRPKYDPPIPLSEGLKAKFDNALSIFVDCIAEKETNGQTFLLRPGMVDIIRRLNDLKQAGAVKGAVIYSNNGNLANLILVGKLLEKLANAPGFFCNYIHWFNPMRSAEVERKLYGAREGIPGRAAKTIAVLKRAFETGTCGMGEISDAEFRENLYFFDDVVHQDISTRIGDRYFHNPQYKKNTPLNPLLSCFERAFTESGLATDSEYYDYTAYVFGGNPRTLAYIKSFISKDYAEMLRKGEILNEVPNNTAFRAKFESKFPAPVARVTRNAFTRAVSTMRRLEKQQNEGTALTEANAKNLTNAQAVINTYEAQNPNAAGGRRKTKKTRKSKSRKTRGRKH